MDDTIEKDELSRRDLLRSAGLVTAGTAALTLGVTATASAQPSATSAFAEGYLRHPDVGVFLVQAVADAVPVSDNVQPLPAPGRGFDADLGAPAFGDNRDKNKGRNPSWCLLKITSGALRGFPPQNSGGVDAVRLVGEVEDAADPSLVGVPIAVHVSSPLVLTPEHSICTIKFFFGSLPVLTGRGIALVNH